MNGQHRPLYFKNKILNIFLSEGIFSFLKLAANASGINEVAPQNEAIQYD